MTDYKLVPVEPTLDMLCEGMEVYASEDCAEADVLGIYKAMLAAAPAVQGEPVASPTAGMNLGQRIRHVGGCETERGIVRFGSVMAVKALVDQVLRDIATTPQSAPDVPGLTEALRQYQHNDGSGLVFGYDKLLVDQYVAQLVEAPQPVEHQPDASGLVVTLKSIEEWVMRYADPKHPVATVARKALADYRKQGGEA